MERSRLRIRLKRISQLIAILLAFATTAPTPLNAADECGFGYEYFSLFSLDGERELDAEEKCRITTWDYSKTNDGFSKYFSISMSPDDEDETNTGVSDIEIFCDKRKIEVYVWVEYPDSQGWNGTGQLRFDSSSSKSFAYLLQKDFDGIVVKDVKSFMQNIVKAKKKVSFKIPTVDGYEVLVYPIGNLLEYRSIFAKSGCKF
jgi:hypothetical protein